MEAALRDVEDRSDLKVIVAPTTTSASSIRTALARSGRGLVNLEALTPGGLAFHILKAMDPIGARQFVDGLTLECVIAGALARRDENPLASLFSRSVAAVTKSIASDRMAGRQAQWAKEHSKGAAQRLYAELFEEYEAYLRVHGLFDQASVLDEALHRVERFRSERHLGKVLVVRETPLFPKQAMLLDALASDGKGVLIGSTSASRSQDSAGAFLKEWDASQSEVLQAEPRILQAATRREEVLTVFQEIRDRGIAISDVELAVTDLSVYRPLIRSLGHRLGLPVAAADSHADGAFVQWLVAMLEWMHSPNEADVLAGMLRTHHLSGVEDPTVLATTLDQFPVTMSMLDRPGLHASLMEGAKRSWTDTARVDELLRFLKAFQAHRWPARLSARQALLRLKQSAIALWPMPDGTAVWRHIEDQLSGFDVAPDEALPARWLASRMAGVLSENGNSARDIGTEVMVVPFQEAGFGPRNHVWVLGLDDKAAARVEGQERSHFAGFEAARDESMNGVLRQGTAELRRRIGSNLTLCAPSFDVQDGRFLFPSAALIEHGGITKLKPQRRDANLDLADTAATGRVRAEFEHVNAGQQALAARRASEWTAWDGVLSAIPDGEKPNLRASTSRLEMLAACPFKFWLSEILEVPVAPEPAREWLSASDLGLMVHDLFERHTRSRAAGHSGTGAEDEKEMLLQLRAALERQAIRSGAERSAAVGQRYEELAQAVEQYFQRERALEGERKPVHAEYPIHEPNDPESRTISIQLPSGTIQLSGRIDRIDESVDGTWIIIDYKTGSWKDFVPAKLKSLDAKLQWALYSMAAERLSGRVVEQAEYVFTSHRGSGWVSAAAPPPEEVILDLLNLLLARFRAGVFVQAADKNGVCTWCDFKAVCGDLDERKSQLKAKFECGSDEVATLFETWAHKPR